MASVGSYWCYRCSRFLRVRVRDQEDAVLCPDCGSGFVEEIRTPIQSPHGHNPFPAAAMYADSVPNSLGSSPAPAPVPGPRLRRRQRSSRDRSTFNPVVVLRGSEGGTGDNEGIGADRGNFELYYDDGAGSGLQPIPSSMSEFLMGSGFDRLLDQLAQLEVNGVGRLDHPPASKAAVESMPIVKIVDSHVSMESHCAVCKEQFELDAEACEMPCKHIYHSDCIFPWLSIRNSCPVCRHQMPTDVRGSGRNSPESNGTVGEEETVGLTIWRLPGGGFAVGRFNGGRRGVERELPVVFTEMDGGFNTSGAPRRISWASGGSRMRESNRIGRVFRNVASFFGRFRRSSTHSNPESGLFRRSHSTNVFGRLSRRRNQQHWAMNEN